VSSKFTVLLFHSTLKVDATQTFETLVPNHNITRRHHPEKLDFNLHHRENLKYRNILLHFLEASCVCG